MRCDVFALLATAPAAGASAEAPNLATPAALVELMLDSRVDMFNRPDELTAVVAELGLVWAVIFVILGSICVFNGYRWHKLVILVLAMLGGATAGLILGPRVGAGEIIPAMLVAALTSVAAWPVMRYTVALFAGLAGAFCGANMWSALGQAPEQHYIGSIIGLLALGMLAFIAFRLVIIAFTAILGSALLSVGVLAAMLRLPSWQSGVAGSLESNPLLLPMIAGALALIGIVFQQGGGLSGLVEAADKPAKEEQEKKKAKPATSS